MYLWGQTDFVGLEHLKFFFCGIVRYNSNVQQLNTGLIATAEKTAVRAERHHDKTTGGLISLCTAVKGWRLLPERHPAQSAGVRDRPVWGLSK